MFLEGTESFISAILWTNVKIRVPLGTPPLGEIPKISENPARPDVHLGQPYKKIRGRDLCIMLLETIASGTSAGGGAWVCGPPGVERGPSKGY